MGMLRSAGMFGIGVAVVAAAQAGTVAIMRMAGQLKASRAQISALQHASPHPSAPRVVTVTPTPGTTGGAPRSPQPVVPGRITVVAVSRRGAATGSGSVGGGVRTPAPGPSSPPQTPPSTPPSPQPPPRQATCSTARVTAKTPPLGALACADVQATAKTGSTP